MFLGRGTTVTDIAARGLASFSDEQPVLPEEISMTIDVDLPATAVESFTKAFHGRIVRSSDADYETARRVWNAAIDRYPVLMARVADVDDVHLAVAFAREQGLPLAVRGGGHNVAGAGMCEGGVVLDLSGLRTVDVDPERRTARVGGGALWSDVDAASAAHGLHTTGGLISHTGVGGLTLGGGIGWLMRQHGLTCDNLVAATLATADGRTLTIDEVSDPELLWGLRGGGGNFGVVTSFTFRLHSVTEVLGGLMLYRGDRAAEAAAAYVEWCAALPDELTTMGAFSSAPPQPFVPEDMQLKPCFAVVGCGTDVAVTTPYVDALRRTFAPDVDVLGPMPYLALQSMLDGGAPAGLRGYWKSGNLSSVGPDLVGHVAEAALKPRSPLSMIHLHHLGGATRGPAHRAITSLGDASWVLNVVGTWSDPATDAENIEWVRDLWALVEPSTLGAYPNFLGEEGTDRVRSAYDEDSWARLVALKRRLDPDNVFRTNQNIDPQTGQRDGV
jgi:FAD/FMN-containing dehydrogenase